MKIISEGNIPSPPKKWWAGQRICCGFCTAEFILEADDDVTEIIEKNLNGGILVRFHCPICTQKLTHEKPIPRKENSWKNTMSQKHLIDQLEKSNIPHFVEKLQKNVAEESKGKPVMQSRARFTVPVIEPDMDFELEEIELTPIDRLQVPNGKGSLFPSQDPDRFKPAIKNPLPAPLQKSERGKKDFRLYARSWKWLVIFGLLLICIIIALKVAHQYMNRF
jgi:hypothetical protein